jgi:hypothetical protein
MLIHLDDMDWWVGVSAAVGEARQREERERERERERDGRHRADRRRIPHSGEITVVIDVCVRDEVGK